MFVNSPVYIAGTSGASRMLPAAARPLLRWLGPIQSSPMLPFSVQRIDHLVFRVSDLKRSVAFYKAVLGCEIVRERHDLGLVHLRAGASMIDLISINGALGLPGGPAPGTQARNVDHLCLRVDPFNESAIFAHLSRNGVIPHGPASENFGAEGRGLSLYFADPDGNSIELKGPSSGGA